MNKKLIAIDLDGTALYDMYTITNETVETLNEVRKLGHEVVISTGRAFRSTIDFYNKLNLKTPIINYNGALISINNGNGFDLVEKFINHKHINDIFVKNKSHINNAFCEHINDYYVYNYDSVVKKLLNPDYSNGTLYEGNLDETLKTDPNGFIIIAHENKGHLIEKYIKDNFKGEIDCRNWGGNNKHVIEVFTIDTSKGIALEYVAKLLGFEMKDVIAFGDAENDIDMIKRAGLGVVMDNATAEVKAYSDDIAPHHQKDGVSQYLKKYFNLR